MSSKSLGSAQYDALQIFNTVHLVAYGENPTYGYKNYFARSPLAIFPPLHTFYSDAPSGFVLPAFAPFVANISFPASEEVASLRVYDLKGEHTVPVRQLSPVTLDLEKVTESSSQGVINVHGNQDDVRNLYAGRVGIKAQPRAYYERSLGRWVDPFTPPRITADCVKWCSITPWDKWCCGHAYRTEAMRVEAVLTVTIAEPADIEQQIEIALRDAAVAGAFAALAAGVATGGSAAGNAFVATFTAALQAKLATLIAEKILSVNVVFRTEWGPL